MTTIRTEARAFRKTAPARGLLGRLLVWLSVARERDMLAELDERMLKDIGITREAAQQEAARPFWETGRRF